ncbi:MAG TPA: methylated-DNA--[protein]-cysteine S-methyltransferase [Allosphingosinicella sp.]|jgi:methylated-DNA-[protein]-cysteine S-methyltransferase
MNTTIAARQPLVRGIPEQFMLRVGEIGSPVGEILLAWDGDGFLRALDFGDYRARFETLLRRHYGGIDISAADCPLTVRAALVRYFDGDFAALDALPLAANGTAFQHSVWSALRRIPAGTTWTYGRLAAELGTPAACRAVGSANGANPLALVLPCHRVIGTNGSLTGYGGGIERKRALLAHEGVPLPRSDRTP